MDDWNTVETPYESENMNSHYAKNHDRTIQGPCEAYTGTKNKNANTESDVMKKVSEIGTVCKEAMTVINGGRKDCYGRPENSFEAIADLDDAFFYHAGSGPSPQWRVAMHNVMQKLGRITANPMDRDSYRDLIGYAAIACDMVAAADVEKGDRHDPE